MLIAGTTRRWPYYVFVTPASTVTSDLYFDLSLLTVFWTKVRSDGGDVRVFAQDGVTPVAREVSGFDYANKRGSLFVATSGATAFYITCGSGVREPAANSAYGKYNVWESAAKLVAHLEDTSDATGYQSALANNGATGGQAGILQKAYSFGGASNLDTGDASPLDFTGATPMTVILWAQEADISIPRVLVDKGATMLHTSKGWAFFTSEGKRYFQINGGTTYAANELQSHTFGEYSVDLQWHQLAVTYDGSKRNAGVAFYVDGSVKIKDAPDTDTLTQSASNSGDFTIGDQAGGVPGLLVQ